MVLLIGEKIEMGNKSKNVKKPCVILRWGKIEIENKPCLSCCNSSNKTESKVFFQIYCRKHFDREV